MQQREVVVKHNVNDDYRSMWVDGAMHCCFSEGNLRDATFNRHYMLIYVYEGNGYLRNANNETELITQGSLLLFRPKERQCFWVEGNERLCFYGIIFYGRVFDRLLSKNSFMSTMHEKINLNKELISSMSTLLTLMESEKKSNDILLYSNLFSILAMCKVDLESVNTNGNAHKMIPCEDPIDRVIEYLTHNYNRRITIGDIAKYVGYSVTWVEDKFMKRYNMSPIKYLSNIRINKAKQLLYEDKHNISEICYIVGYNDPLYFSKVFKKTTGISPQKYKDTCKKHLFI